MIAVVRGWTVVVVGSWLVGGGCSEPAGSADSGAAADAPVRPIDGGSDPRRDGGSIPSPTCSDMMRNGSETGVDCGGPDCGACEAIEDADFYVSPDGDDDGPGTIDAPFATWGKLNEVLEAGQLAYIRGGNYYVDAPLDSNVQERIGDLDGRAGAPIRIFAYPGERPVLDYTDRLRGADVVGLYVQDAAYVHLRGLRITGLAQNPAGGIQAGLVVQRVTNSVFERLEVDHVGGYGVALLDGAHDNLFLNCDAHHLADEHTGYENANGFMITGGVDATRNTFEGCRAYWVCDDGFDLFGIDGEVTIRGSWAFWNGYRPGTFEPVGDGMGLKLGPTQSYCCGGPDRTGEVLRRVHHNLAFENAHGGFDQNGGLTIYELYNNTSYANGEIGFAFGYDGSISQRSRNNVSHGEPRAYSGAEIEGDHNSWNGVPLSDAEFASVDSRGMDGPRGPGGELPVLDFLRPLPGSSLVDTGADVGLPFEGSAPDLGCFER